jgi:hypothetical protein
MMDGRSLPWPILVGLVVAAVAGGCTDSPSSPFSAPAPTSASPTQMPSASLPDGTAAPPTSPVATTASVTGTSTCQALDLVFTTGPDSPSRARNGTIRCTDTVSDPRVSGTATGVWNMDLWGTLGNGAATQWGTSRLENGGGAWEGKASGVFSSDRGDMYAVWYRGTGGYAGLGYFALITGLEPRQVRGMIFPGAPPDLSGMPPVTGPQPTPGISPVPTVPPAPRATAVAYGPTSAVTGASVITLVELAPPEFAAVVATNDPRVSGDFLGRPWTMQFTKVPGSDAEVGPQWGSGRIENSGGAWQGVASGVYDQIGDLIVAWYTGTGGYAGLSYYEVVTRNDLFGPVDEFGYGNFGLIVPGAPPTP